MSLPSGPARAGAVLRDGLLLATGTLSAVPVPAPRELDRRRAAVAMLAAPVVGLGIGAVAVLAAAGALLAGLPPLAAGALALAGDALLTRFLHLDGLADTADGLAAAAHGERDRALEVMRRGDVGPVGVATLLLTLLTATACLGAVAASWTDPAARAPTDAAAAVLAAWAASRTVLPLACMRGGRPARRDGLGTSVVGTVPRAAAVACAGVVTGCCALAAGLPGAMACAAALATGAAWTALAHRRLGGLTGDVLGAAVVVAHVAGLAAAAAALAR